MLNIWDYPQAIMVGGKEYSIRSDYRVIIEILKAFADPEMVGDTKEETNYIRCRIALELLFPDWEEIPTENWQEAMDQIVQFIDMGTDENSKKPSPRLMDWEQDAKLIIPAVNRVLNKEIRAERYIHWWTFLSAYLEIGECSFSHILALRSKKAKGKKMEKWEEEYCRDNADVVYLKTAISDEEKKALDDLLG